MIGTYESRGVLVQSGESKLAMRFTDPQGEAIVMDGEHIWVYTPSTTPGQVIRLKVPSDPTYGPNVLAWILTNPAQRYRARYIRSDAIGGPRGRRGTAHAHRSLAAIHGCGGLAGSVRQSAPQVGDP